MSLIQPTTPPSHPTSLDEHKQALITASFDAGALKFGSFVLKSGRVSPYFFNAGLLSSGSALHPLALAYAHTIYHSLHSASSGPTGFDIIFGPAYKGIPFAALACHALYTSYGLDVGYAYNRKEVKDHGEGGSVVGAPLKGKRVVVLDDVMTSGMAVREALEIIKAQGGEVVGVVELLDREEVGGREGKKSTVQELEEEAGVSVKAVLRMRDLVGWLEGRGMSAEVEAMKAYREKYGVPE